MIFKDIIFHLGYPIYLDLIRYLLPHAEGLSGNALAQLTGVSCPKANGALGFLVGQGILSKRSVGKSYLYRICPEHVLLKQILLPQLEFQKNIYLGLGQFIAKYLKPRPSSIILYGSMARGEENPDSDIDIILVYSKKIKEAPSFEDYDELIAAVNRRYGNNLSVRRAYKSQLLEKYRSGDSWFQDLVREGIVIHGEPVLKQIKYGKNH